MDLDIAAASNEISEGLFGESSSSGGETTTLGAEAEGEVVEKPASADTATAGSESTAASDATAAPAPAPTTIPAPRTWRKEAAAIWETIPELARAEIAKREEDIFKGLEGYKQQAEVGKALTEILNPYREVIQASNAHPLQFIQGILQVDTLLRKGTPEQKAQVWAQLAKGYGIDPGQPPGEMPYVDPEVKNLRAELHAIKSKLDTQSEATANQLREKLRSEIDAFANDPANVHFSEVANDIAQLLSSGVAADLKSAYDKAVWANPVTRVKEQARLSAEAEAKAKTKAANTANVAAAQSATVKARGVPGHVVSKGSMEDTIAKTLADIKAR